LHWIEALRARQRKIAEPWAPRLLDLDVGFLDDRLASATTAPAALQITYKDPESPEAAN